MSAAEKTLSASAPAFVPTNAAGATISSDMKTNKQINSVSEHPKGDYAPSLTAADDGSIRVKKKKTKDERSAPRKRRHQRGKSGGFDRDSISPTRGVKKPDIDVVDGTEFGPLMWRESPSHYKTNSDGQILTWFDEIKQRRMSRFKTVPDLYGDVDDSVDDGRISAAHLSLVFSQPQDWVFGKSVTEIRQLATLEVEDYEAEKIERKKWQDWAQSAAEMERRRRIQVLQELDAEQEIERQRRRRWAIKAIEKEKAERISAQFLSSLSSTNWFNETITAYHEDYELVCPYYKLGCRVSCRRGNIEKHLKKCRFALDLIEQPLPELTGGYEVVCPNSILGCTYIGGLDALQHHLTECAHAGQTAQQEIEERTLLKQHVIMQQEEERERRVRFDDNVVVVKRPRSTDGGGLDPAAISNQLSIGISDSTTETVQQLGVPYSEDVSDNERFVSTTGDVDSSENSDGGSGRPRSMSRKKALLQSLLEEQTKSVIRCLNTEAKQFYLSSVEIRSSRYTVQEEVINLLRSTIHCLWSFADILPFGSHATGLSSLSSDLDLVVCFSDQYKSLPSITGVVPLLQNLAECIQRQTSDVFVIRKVLLHSAVPIIKADVLKSGLYARGILRDDEGSSKVEIESGNKIKYTQAVPEITCLKPSADGALLTNQSQHDDDIFLSVDISIDGPSHSGLATTEFVRSMLNVSPILAPAVCVLKEFFKAKGLSDPYHGGLSSYGIFLLVLLLYQRQNRLLFSTGHSPSPKNITISPGRSVRRSFSFGDDEISTNGAKRCGSLLKLFTSMDGAKRNSDGGKEDFSRIRSLSTTDVSSDTNSTNATTKAPSYVNNVTSEIALLNCRSTSIYETPDSLVDAEAVKHDLSDNSAKGSSEPRSQQEGLTKSASPPLSRYAQNSPAGVIGSISCGTGATKGAFSPGNYGWKKVQQQLDFGCKVADKLLGVKQVTSKRRHSKTKVAKPLPDGGHGNPGVELSMDHLTDPLQNVSRINSGDYGPLSSVCEDARVEDTELGHLLVDFLEYYGEAWDSEKVGFSVRDGGFKFDLVNSAGTPSHPQADDPFVIEDPVNVMNNVAKSCYNVAGVMRCIQDAYGKYRACVVKPGSGGGAISPRRASSGMFSSTLQKETDSSRTEELKSSSLPISTLSNEIQCSVQLVADSSTNSHHDKRGIEEDTNSGSPNVAEVEVNMKIFSRSSVRMNIRTRATNYMQQHTKGTTNSPVNPTKKLDPIQSIVSEIFGLNITSLPADAV